MNSIILHISDLHVSLDQEIGGGPKQFDSYLSTKKNEEESNYFIDKFTQSVNDHYPSERKYLLITGDITNAGEKKEFVYVEKFINRIINNLKIDISDILIVPGDHDYNRRDLQTLLVDDELSSLDKKNEVKFKNFSQFYKNLLNKQFDSKKVIFDSLVIEDKLILLGLNSTLKIDLQNTLGSVDIEKFEKEFSTYDLSNKKTIACVHHNFTSGHENKNNGQWESSNRTAFINKLLTSGINYIFTGNEHTNNCKSIFLGELTTSDSGTLSSQSYESTYKVYPVIINDDIILQNKIYALHKTNGNDSPYEWDVRTNKTFSQPDEFVVFKKTPPDIEEDIDSSLPEIKPNVPIDLDLCKSKINYDVYQNSKFTDALYEMVKKMGAFHSGHFHWSETSRAHNWIDISKLIEDRDNLNFLKDAIIDVLEEKIGIEKIDLIVGLGYEGNILATKAAIKYNKDYSFLPYSYRHDEHHDYETRLNFTNETGTYKNILIVTDVVNDGRTIRKLVKKRQNEFFNTAEKIYVISLFYTGESTLNYDILNYSFLKTIPNYDLESDEEVDNIGYYTVKALKVEKCPYGKNFREECFIYKDELSCVNLFYDESKHLLP